MRKYISVYILGMVGILSLLATKFPMPEQIKGLSYEQFQWLLLVNPILLLLLFGTLGCIFAPKLGLSSDLLGVMPKKSHISWNLIFIYMICNLPISIACSYWLRQNLLTDPPEVALVTRFLYGSITEEIVMRWGALSTFLWIITKLFKDRLKFETKALWSILLSSTLFALGHFGMVGATFIAIPSVYICVFLGNFAIGFAAGSLFVKNNLEAAIVFHLIMSLVLYLVDHAF